MPVQFVQQKTLHIRKPITNPTCAFSVIAKDLGEAMLILAVWDKQTALVLSQDKQGQNKAVSGEPSLFSFLSQLIPCPCAVFTALLYISKPNNQKCSILTQRVPLNIDNASPYKKSPLDSPVHSNSCEGPADLVERDVYLNSVQRPH